MPWGPFLFGWLVGSFLGLMQVWALLKSMTAKRAG
jgi:hypothetical protein